MMAFQKLAACLRYLFLTDTISSNLKLDKYILKKVQLVACTFIFSNNRSMLVVKGNTPVLTAI